MCGHLFGCVRERPDSGSSSSERQLAKGFEKTHICKEMQPDRATALIDIGLGVRVSRVD